LQRSNWKDIAELFGIAAIVASLIFVGLQMKQTDEIAAVQLLNDANERTRELNTLIADHADVWGRGCAGEELSDSERVRFAQIYSAYRNSAYISWRRIVTSGLSDSDPSYVINGFAANHYRFAGLRSLGESLEIWDEDGRKYSDPDVALFAQQVRSRVAELAEIEPEPIVDIAWCGRI
jgi:hypothetical protein